MTTINDGPSTKRFFPITIEGNYTLSRLSRSSLSRAMKDTVKNAPQASCVSWGIPFEIDKKIVFIKDKPVDIPIDNLNVPWLVFLHTSDNRQIDTNEDGFISPMRGAGMLGELAANYTILYADGSKVIQPIRRRHEIGAFQRMWGDNCFQAVAHRKPRPLRPHHEQTHPAWGFSQTRADASDGGGRFSWTNWLYAWENPHPGKKIVRLICEPVSGIVILSAVSAGRASSNPLRWESREKAVLRLKKGDEFKPELLRNGLLEQIHMDMGQIISAQRRPVYPAKAWSRTYNNQLPDISDQEVLIEYTAHKDAKFRTSGSIKLISPSSQRIKVKVVLKGSRKPVAAKLHIHGESGEYLSPVDRHRIPNPAWFEDYAPEFIHIGQHRCTYINGETTVDLPLGKVFVEVSKGFEIKPVRRAVTVKPSTKEIVIEIERVLPWREKGWVTADTHVHFLSPQTALVEGAAEGVNVVNLLASQWGELMTNVGDFDGRMTHGSKEAGGDGEYLVRVGTENRQHVMGHISLLGYNGSIIAPMTTGAPMSLLWETRYKRFSPNGLPNAESRGEWSLFRISPIPAWRMRPLLSAAMSMAWR